MFSQIFAVLYKEISSPDVTKALSEGLKTLSQDTQKQLEDAGKKSKAAADEEVKKQVETMDKDLKSNLDEVSKSSKGLLGE